MSDIRSGDNIDLSQGRDYGTDCLTEFLNEIGSEKIMNIVLEKTISIFQTAYLIAKVLRQQEL